MSTKEAIIRMTQSLPDGVTWAEVVAEGTARFGDAGDEAISQIVDDPAFDAELDRRLADHESGRVKGIPADEFFRQLKKRRR